MTEPVSTTSGAIYAVTKFMLYVGLPASVAVTIVMAMTHPKTTREWVIALISTSASSIYGGAFLIRYFNLTDWAIANDAWASLGGIYLAAGLPAWVLIRATFLWVDRNSKKDIAELAKQVKEDLGKCPILQTKPHIKNN